MNEKSESWSLPWHALQRRLAETFNVSTGKNATGGYPAAFGSNNASASPANWLVRAQVAAGQASAPGC